MFFQNHGAHHTLGGGRIKRYYPTAHVDGNAATAALLPMNANNESGRFAKQVNENECYINNVNLNHLRTKLTLIIML